MHIQYVSYDELAYLLFQIQEIESIYQWSNWTNKLVKADLSYMLNAETLKTIMNQLLAIVQKIHFPLINEFVRQI